MVRRTGRVCLVMIKEGSGPIWPADEVTTIATNLETMIDVLYFHITSGGGRQILFLKSGRTRKEFKPRLINRNT